MGAVGHASSLAGTAVLTALVGLASYFLYCLYLRRRLFAQLRAQGVPMMPWSPISGHLQILPKLLAALPHDADQSYPFQALAREFPDSDGLYYMDLWPFFRPLMVITSPPLAAQAASAEHDLPKPDSLVPFFAPITGGPSMFETNGAQWKHARMLFNPGFSAGAILQTVDSIVAETEVYCDVIREKARKGVMFQLDELTCWYMMDVIGVATLNTRLDSQRGYNALAAAMRSQMAWHIRGEELNPFKRYNPARKFMYWYNGRRMDTYIGAELDKRYAELRSHGFSALQSKCVMDLAIAGHMSEKKDQAADKLDEDFKKWATAQIRLFLFAGHDSTAATIVYALYLLSKHPETLAKVRQEHDAVFGRDISQAAQQLRQTPQLINQVPLTVAVIKETLRLFTPAAGLRGGKAGVFLRDGQGNTYPTDGIAMWILHPGIHRNPQYWPRADEFVPERWLVPKGDPLHPVKGGWRPFESGPRNCIGQTLVMLDVKVTLVMMVREFDVTDAYDEWDRLHATKGIRTVRGERCYQVSQGASHPADGFPCRVSIRAQG